jgi:hypothetical protein
VNLEDSRVPIHVDPGWQWNRSSELNDKALASTRFIKLEAIIRERAGADLLT